MTTADILAEMKTLLATRADLERSIQRIQTAVAAYRSPVIDGMPRNAPAHPQMFEISEQFQKWSEQLENNEQELVVFRRRLEPMIHDMPDCPQRMMLRLRYIHWLAVNDAAKQAGYARQYAYRLLAEGEAILIKM